MNKTFEKAVWMVLAVLMLAVPVALANHSHGLGDGHEGYGHRQWGMKGGDFESQFFIKSFMILRNDEGLGLTDVQKGEIRGLVHEVKKNTIRQNAEIEILDLDITQAMHGNAVDPMAVNKLVDQKYELEKAKAKSLVEGIARLKKSLTEDQQTKLKGLFKQGKEGCPFMHQR